MGLRADRSAPLRGEPGTVHVILGADHTRIVLSGEIDADLGTDLHQATADAEHAGLPIEVDTHHVTFMDSSGLSVLIVGERRLHPLGGSLAVACSDRVRRLLTMTGLQGFLRLYSNRDDALRAAIAAPGFPAASTPDAP